MCASQDGKIDRAVGIRTIIRSIFAVILRNTVKRYDIIRRFMLTRGAESSHPVSIDIRHLALETIIASQIPDVGNGWDLSLERPTARPHGHENDCN